jgi:hypothetical protein
MKKIHLIPSVFILMLLLSSTTFAATSSASTSKMNELKQKILDLKQKASEKKVEAKAKIASTTEKLKNAKSELKDRIEIKLGKKLDAKKIKIANEFEKSLLILKNLLARTESRILKMESENISASSSRPLLVTAKTKLTLAETELTNFENALALEVPAATSTNTAKKAERKTQLKNLNSQAEKVKSAMKTAHKSIVEVIASLKRGLRKDEKSSPTLETVSTSTNN